MFLINGLFSESVPVHDRGLQYGDGLFETLAMVDGSPLCWEAHYQRLQDGCERLGISCPSMELLRSEIDRLPVDSSRHVVKIIVTAGQGGRGYGRPPEQHTAVTRILGLYPWPGYPHEHAALGVKTKICATRLGQNPQLAGLKHLNRLEQVLARSEWASPEIAEGLMLDTQGSVIEGTMSNLFCIKDDVLLTPDLSACGIAGIIRGCILDLANRHKIPAKVCALTEVDLYKADELFLCNSIIGIWPVRKVEERIFTVGPRSHEIRQSLIRLGIIAA